MKECLLAATGYLNSKMLGPITQEVHTPLALVTDWMDLCSHYGHWMFTKAIFNGIIKVISLVIEGIVRVFAFVIGVVADVVGAFKLYKFV